jgi:hypothetical protein
VILQSTSLRLLEFGARLRSLKRTGYLIHYRMGLATKDSVSSKPQVRRRLHIAGKYSDYNSSYGGITPDFSASS